MTKRRRSGSGSRPVDDESAPTGAREDDAFPVRSLLVQPQRGQPASRLQRTFNRLVEEAAALEARLATQRDDLEALLSRYRDRVEKLDRGYALAQLALAQALAEAQARVGLRGNQRQDLAATICSLCEDAFLSVAPDAGTEALYDEWSDRSLREQVEAAAARSREPRDEQDDDPRAAGSRRGDGEDLRGRASHAKDDDGFERDGGAEDDRGDDGGDRFHHHGRRGADSAAREARRRDQEALARRSVREVYLTLARVLHPDAVVDPERRPEREDAMKLATAAYREGDLLALLRLELRWLRRSGEGRETPGDATLRAWIRALREQVEKLEDAVAAQCADPRYDAIAGLAFLPAKKALAEIESRARQLRAATAEMVDLRAAVHACETKQELAGFVRGARHDRLS